MTGGIACSRMAFHAGYAVLLSDSPAQSFKRFMLACNHLDSSPAAFERWDCSPVFNACAECAMGCQDSLIGGKLSLNIPASQVEYRSAFTPTDACACLSAVLITRYAC